MDVAKIRIGFEQSIGKELYTLMDGEILEEIIKKAKIEKIENEWKFILEGHSFRVTKEMMPTLHSVCLEVKAKLEFNEDIDFYINNSPELNAFSISRIENDQPHLISINSGLLERLDDDELKFIIGHEIGHLITHNADISRLISFVFPHDNKIPLIIYHKIRLWEKLSELTADRFGYMASPNLEKCVSCFFKLSSGLDTKRINFDYSAYLTENERILNYFKTEKGTNLLSHPINPMRIKAIELFSKSELYQNIINKQDKEEDKVLEEQIDTLTDILMVLSNSQIDRLRSYFIASAGIIVSGIDKQIDKEEIEKIIYELSYLSIFPKEFLSQIYESGKAEDIFKDTIQQILTINPSDRNIMFNYCIGIAIGDKRIAKEEIDFIFGLGKTHFGYEEKEAAQIISENIRDRFMPSLYT